MPEDLPEPTRGTAMWWRAEALAAYERGSDRLDKAAATDAPTHIARAFFAKATAAAAAGAAVAQADAARELHQLVAAQKRRR